MNQEGSPQPLPEWIPGADVSDQPLVDELKRLFGAMDEQAVRTVRRLNVAMKIATHAFEAKNWGVCVVALADLQAGAGTLSDNYVLDHVELPEGVTEEMELTGEVSGLMETMAQGHLRQYFNLIAEHDAWVDDEEKRDYYAGQ